jgi:hypothetical protein
MHVSYRIFALAVALALSIWTTGIRDQLAAATADDALVIQRFELPKDSTRLLLPVKLNGQEYRFDMDTGSMLTCYDSSLIPLLGELSRWKFVIDPGRSVALRGFGAPDLRIGTTNVRFLREVMAFDMEPFREVSGDEYFGIVGMDFLQRHVVRIDPDRREVAFLRSPGNDSGQRVPFRYNSSACPEVDVTISGLEKPEPFLIDTGFTAVCSGSLRKKTYQALLKLKQLNQMGYGDTITYDGRQECRVGQLHAINWNGFRHEDLLFGEDVFGEDPDANILGMGYLSRYVVTFDFPGQAMYLKKGKRYAEPEIEDMSGLMILKKKGKLVVDTVMEDSAGARAGIRANDVILGVDGESADKLHLNALRTRLFTEGKKTRLTLSREGKEREVELTAPGRQRSAPAGN